MKTYFFTGCWGEDIYASIPFKAVDDQQAVVDAHRLFERFTREWEASRFIVTTLEIGGIDATGNCETTFSIQLWDSADESDSNITLDEECRRQLYILKPDPFAEPFAENDSHLAEEA